MARKKPGENLHINRLVQQNLARRISTFRPVFVECPNEIEVEREDGTKTKEICKGTMWDKKTLYQVFFVPQSECQRQGGICSTKPHDHFLCVKCGHILNPGEWNKLAKETYEAGEKKIITLGDVSPDNNGDGEVTPDA